jgi:hypothetical protein
MILAEWNVEALKMRRLEYRGDKLVLEIITTLTLKSQQTTFHYQCTVSPGDNIPIPPDLYFSHDA